MKPNLKFIALIVLLGAAFAANAHAAVPVIAEPQSNDVIIQNPDHNLGRNTHVLLP